MRLNIVHTTSYQYGRAVRFNPHRLMLRPRQSPDVRITAHALTCNPAAEISWAEDLSGNRVATARFREPASMLTITSELQVEATAVPWPVFQIPPHAQSYPFAYSPDEIADLGALYGAFEESPTVRRWAESFVRSRPTDTLALLKDINAGVRAAVAYRRRDEEGVQTPTCTLLLATGSCRDLAALFIDAVRHLGFGARAVSGYLFDIEAPERSEDTTHAWAEVYLPETGWIAFDPTHGRVGEAGLIAMAVGRCSTRTMPVVGSYAGAPGDLNGMDVAVAISLA